jgi:hypothetical protein
MKNLKKNNKEKIVVQLIKTEFFKLEYTNSKKIINLYWRIFGIKVSSIAYISKKFKL